MSFRYKETVFVSCFMLLITFPAIGMLLKGVQKDTYIENRPAAELPSIPLSYKEVKLFPAKAEAFINDHFWLRDKFVNLSKTLVLDGLKTSTNKNVILGKEGWLFYTAEKSIEAYRGTMPFSQDELKEWELFFAEASKRASQLSIDFIVMIPPSSSFIYGNKYFPDWMTPFSTYSRYEAISEVLKKLKIKNIDIRPTFLEKRYKEDLYYKTDTHWNDIGAFYAYKLLSNEIATTLSIKPLGVQDLNKTIIRDRAGDLSFMLSPNNSYKEDAWQLKRKTSADSQSVTIHGIQHAPGSISKITCPSCGHLKLFALRDSFFTAMIPFFVEHFQESTLCWQRDINWELVRNSKPDLFLFELIDRNLMYPAPKNLN
jgi:alginate O-acetyltransferase complex protein AlgJ